MTPISPDHDPLAAGPGTEHDNFENDDTVEPEVERLRERRGQARSERLKITRSEEGTITIAFAHRPPGTSQTGTLIPGEIEAALTYHDPEAALQDASEFVTAALAACRAQYRGDAHA